MDTKPPTLLPRAARPAPHKQTPFLSLPLCVSHTHAEALSDFRWPDGRLLLGEVRSVFPEPEGQQLAGAAPTTSRHGKPHSSHVHGEGLTSTAGNQPPRSVYTPEISPRQEEHVTGVGLPGQPGPSGQLGSVLAEGWSSCYLKKQEQNRRFPRKCNKEASLFTTEGQYFCFCFQVGGLCPECGCFCSLRC